MADIDWTMTTAEIARFWGYVDNSDADACWTWTGAHSTDGYGNFSIHRKPRTRRTYRAHRIAWELLRGPIGGEVLDHICRVRDCVNPAHLRPTSNVENVMAGVSRAAINARKTHCQHGHEFTEENTYRPPNGSRECRICKRALDRKRKSAKRQARQEDAA